MNNSMFTELLPKLYFVSSENGARFPNSHGLMIDSSTKVLVDSGFGSSRREAIIATGEVDIIINTHFHSDHAYGNKYFPNAQVWVHALDAPALRSPEQFQAYTLGLDRINESSHPFHYAGGLIGQEVDKELVDGEVLDFGDVKLQVIHTPGHTPGHIALYEMQTGILFSGDIDLSPFGPWYGNMCSDIDEFADSIELLIKLNPRVVVSSHIGIISEHIPERLREYADKLAQREEQIYKHLLAPKTLEELVDSRIIFRRRPEPLRISRIIEEIMIEKHLQRLMRLGKVVLMPNGQYVACA